MCGTGIPKFILDLPQDILSTPIGQSLLPLIGKIVLVEFFVPFLSESSSFTKCLQNSMFHHLQTERLGAETNGSNSFEPQILGREQSPGFDELNTEIEEARLQSIALERSRTAIRDKIAKKEKKKEKKKKKRNLTDSDCDDYMMASVDQVDQANGASSDSLPAEMLPSQRQLADDGSSIAAEDERKKHREPPIVFKDIEVS